MVIMQPVSKISNQKIKEEKRIEYRPLTEAGFKAMENELDKIDFNLLEGIEAANDQVECFQNTLFNAYDQSFQLKTKIVNNSSEPWYNEELRRLKNKKKREFFKHRKSNKFRSLQKLYKAKLELAKESFYEKKVLHLKKSNPRQWYKQLKMMTKYDQKEDKPKVDSLKHLNDADQAEAIATKFQEIANEYEPLNAADFTIPCFLMMIS